MRKFVVFCALCLALVIVSTTSRRAAVASQSVSSDQPTPSDQSESLRRHTASHRQLHRTFQTGTPLKDGQRRTVLAGTPFDTPGDMALRAGADPVAAFITPLWCGADAIVRGQITGAASDVTDDQSFVFTDYTLRIDAVVKGAGLAPAQVLTLSRPGGEATTAAGRVAVDVTGLDPLLPGHSYVLFLRSARDGVWLADVRLGSFLTDGTQARSTSDRAPEPFFQPGISQNDLDAAISGVSQAACKAEGGRR